MYIPSSTASDLVVAIEGPIAFPPFIANAQATFELRLGEALIYNAFARCFLVKIC
jgi:hypothetical protein